MDVPALDPTQPAPGVFRAFYEAPGGTWSFSQAPATAPLADTVLAFWEAHAFMDYAREKIVPRGTVELIFNLGPPHCTLDPEGHGCLGTYTEAWISGLHDHPLITAPTSETRTTGSLLVAASLPAAALWGLFGLPGHVLRNTVRELSDIVDAAEVTRLRQRMHEASATSQRFEILAEYLARRRSKSGRPVSPLVNRALGLLRGEGGDTRIDELSVACGASRKHLASRFREEVGMSPKRYARIVRFAEALRRLRAPGAPNMANLAQSCGYYDQAHLVREFRALSGETPWGFLRLRAEDGQSILYD